MKKKIAVLFVLFVLIALLPICASAQEKRVGLGFGKPTTVLVFSYDPWVAKLAYDFTKGNQFMFLSGSYTLINSRPIAGPFTASLGVGGFARFEFEDSKDNSFGANIPISLEIPMLDDFVEVFLEFDPGLELLPKPKLSWKSTCIWLGATIRLD